MMHNPPHVGAILRELYIEPLGISVQNAADHLGVTRQALSRLLNEHSGISAEMAIRLSKVFHTTPDFWMNLSSQFELWKAYKNESEIKVTPFDEAA